MVEICRDIKDIYNLISSNSAISRIYTETNRTLPSVKEDN